MRGRSMCRFWTVAAIAVGLLTVGAPGQVSAQDPNRALEDFFKKLLDEDLPLDAGGADFRRDTFRSPHDLTTFTGEPAGEPVADIGRTFAVLIDSREPLPDGRVFCEWVKGEAKKRLKWVPPADPTEDLCNGPLVVIGAQLQQPYPDSQVQYSVHFTEADLERYPSEFAVDPYDGRTSDFSVYLSDDKWIADGRTTGPGGIAPVPATVYGLRHRLGFALILPLHEVEDTTDPLIVTRNNFSLDLAEVGPWPPSTTVTFQMEEPEEPEETEEPEPDEPAEPGTAATGSTSDDGFPWWLVILIALPVAGGLIYWLVSRARTEGDPCKQEHDMWQAAEDRAGRAETAKQEAEAKAERAREYLQTQESRLEKGHGSELDKTQAEIDVREAESAAAAAAAAAAADSARARADELQRAYLKCMGLPIPEPAISEPTGEPVSAGPGPAIAAAPPGPDGGPCKEGETLPPAFVDDDTVGPFDVSYHLRITPVGVDPEEAKRLALELAALSEEINSITDIVSLGQAGQKAAAGEAGDAGKKLVGTAAGIPTGPVDAAGKILELTAGLGAFVAAKVGRWQEQNKHRQVRVEAATYRAPLKRTWTQHKRCVEGAWECRELLTAELGALQKGTYDIDREYSAGEVDSVVSRMMENISNKLAAGARGIKEAGTPAERSCGE